MYCLHCSEPSYVEAFVHLRQSTRDITLFCSDITKIEDGNAVIHHFLSVIHSHLRRSKQSGDLNTSFNNATNTSFGYTNPTESASPDSEVSIIQNIFREDKQLNGENTAGLLQQTVIDRAMAKGLTREQAQSTFFALLNEGGIYESSTNYFCISE